MTVYLLVQYIDEDTLFLGVFSNAGRAMEALPDVLGVEAADLTGTEWTPGPDGAWDRYPFEITPYVVDAVLATT